MSKEYVKSKEPKRIWEKEYNPLRKIILWGWDSNNNPSFAILYGEHLFKNKRSNELEDNVIYTNYAVFKGKDGHFPSFEAVTIFLNQYDYKTRTYSSHMYYKKECRGYYWNIDNRELLNEFKTFKDNEKITLPYFEQITYEDIIKYIYSQNLQFDDFRVAKFPNEVLNLSNQLLQYYDIICNIFSNFNIYMRKKYLKELINCNPPKEIYDFILKSGSNELISGLFLELSLIKKDILIQQAKEIVEGNIDWTSESYSNGLKRCACIYINSFDEKTKNKRIKYLRKTLPKMDLHLIKIDGQKIPKDKVLDGLAYKQYADWGLISEYKNCYSYEQRKYISTRRIGQYKKGPYTDGIMLNINEFKNTIQEAQTYEVTDIIGKIAYYLDAPRLTYYFKGNSNLKGLMYFRRYIRRILDGYAKNDENKFIESMKVLFTSYTEQDYLCKFKGNFQFNYFIKHYLYYDFKEEAPSYGYNRYEWIKNDQLMKLEGHYEFMHKIWERHLEDVIDIIIDAKINVILKAFYYILKASDNKENVLNNISYDKLVKLSSSSYEPISDMFINVLIEKLKNIDNFDLDIMLLLIKSQNKKTYEIAMEFFNRTKGRFPAESLVEFMFLSNFEDWIYLFDENINLLDEDAYIKFIKTFCDNIDKFIDFNIDFSEDLRNIFSKSIEKLSSCSYEQKKDLLLFIISKLYYEKDFPEFIINFIEEIIFSISQEDIKSILRKTTIKDYKNIVSQQAKLIISLLEIIKNDNLPSDAQIMNILESGTSKMIKTLINIINNSDNELSSRFSTLLIMFESDIIVLNQKAEEIFENLPKKDQQKLHSLIIDSPERKVYSYGLQKLKDIYEKSNEAIPQEFVLQMLQHSSFEIKAYISDKILETIKNLGNGNKELFMYYVRTLLFLPNKVSLSKKNIYEILPMFVNKYKDKLNEVEEILLDIGGSNIISDSERALVSLAQIKKEVISLES